MSTMDSRRIIVVRHGERCDFCFSTSRFHWLDKAIDEAGRYQPFNLNLPRNLPKRRNGYEGFRTDTPLTEMGYLQAKLTGRAFRDRDIKPHHVFVSPSLRSIQTAIGILKGMNDNHTKLHIEYGLFEWMRFVQNRLPTWLTVDECLAAGYPVFQDYTPVVREAELNMNESLLDFYNRSFNLTKTLLNRYPTGNLLFVAHGATLDTCTRQLCGEAPRSNEEFFEIVQKTPYLSSIEARQVGIDQFEILGSAVPPLAHSANSAYESQILTTPGYANNNDTL